MIEISVSHFKGNIQARPIQLSKPTYLVPTKTGTGVNRVIVKRWIFAGLQLVGLTVTGVAKISSFIKF